MRTLARVRRHVDYALARRAVLRDLGAGRLERDDVCDAHPELLRAARNVGEATVERCPICDDANVVLVSYVFGSGLPPHGHCVTSKAELAKVSRRGSDLACYVVEVCPECSWNHLAHTFHLDGRRRRATS